MKKNSFSGLSRRERQIMEIIYKNGEAAASEIRKSIVDPPSYSAVRALLKILENKGHLKHREKGPRYIYYPTLPPDKAKSSALKHLMKTFFDDSMENVVAALLDITGSDLTEEDYERLYKLIEKAKKEGK